MALSLRRILVWVQGASDAHQAPTTATQRWPRLHGFHSQQALLTVKAVPGCAPLRNGDRRGVGAGLGLTQKQQLG